MKMEVQEKIQYLEERIKKLELLVESMMNGSSCRNSDPKQSPVIASFDFSNADCRKNSGWKIFNAENLDSENSLSFRAIQVERTLGVFYDPMVIYENIDISCDDIKYVHVKLKSNVDETKKCMLRVYFTTEKHTDFSQSKSVYDCYQAGRKVDVFVETKNRYWNGILKNLRIDPVENLRGSIEIEFIELMDSNKEVKFRTDFTTANSLEETGWYIKNADYVNCNSNLQFDVGALEKKRIFTDPFIRIENLDIDANLAKYIHIKMRVDIDKKDGDEAYMQILFKTKSSDFWTQEKSLRYSYRTGKDIDAYMEIKQLFWKGTIIALRFDPFETYEGKAEIELIELLKEIPKRVAVDMLETRMRNLEDRFNKIYN